MTQKKKKKTDQEGSEKRRVRDGNKRRHEVSEREGGREWQTQRLKGEKE